MPWSVTWEAELSRGIGAALAARIVRRFGAKTFEIMEREPERLAEIRASASGKPERLPSRWRKSGSSARPWSFLREYGISVNLAVKVYERYEQEIYRIIKENPYRLAEDIAGVGFRTADEIAKRWVFGRIRIPDPSGLLYTLLGASSEGHTCLPEELLLRKRRSCSGFLRRLWNGT